MRGENILELAGDAEDLLSVVLCMKKLKGETKNRQHANSQQRDDRVKAYTQHGIMGAAASAVSEVCCGAGDGLERSWLEGMQIDIYLKKGSNHFHNT